MQDFKNEPGVEFCLRVPQYLEFFALKESGIVKINHDFPVLHSNLFTQSMYKFKLNY